MSESVEDAATEVAETPVEAVEPQVEEEAPEQAAEAQEQPQEPQKPKEPVWWMKRINAQTRQNADLHREVAALRSQLAERNAGQLESTEQPRETPKVPVELTQEAIDAAADKKLAEREAEQRRAGVIDSGVKEFGAEDWNAKTQILAGMGAVNNSAFMEALLELPNAHKLVASLAENPNELGELLNKRPSAMASAMGRMAAAMESAPAKPVLSKAPAPVKPISTRGTQAEPDPAKMSMKEYVAWREANAPRKLGGKAKRA